MAKTPEGKVKKDIKAELERNNVFAFADICAGRVKAEQIEGFFYMPVAGRFSVLGVHDIVGCWAGTFFSLETKREGADDATFHQERFQTAATASGGLSYVGVRDISVINHLRAEVMRRSNKVTA